jgi:hypothetical protein
MPSVFISANSKDYGHADYVYQFLKNRGVDAFFCRHSLTEAGKSKFKDTIDQALDACSHLVLVTSSVENTESSWVKYEINLFTGEQIRRGERGGQLVTVRTDALDESKLAIALRQYQILDYHTELEQLPSYLQGSGNDEGKAASLHLPAGVRKLGVLSVLFAVLGAFLLPAGIAAVASGLIALRKLKVMPGANGWRWIAGVGIALGTVEILLIIGAFAEGLGRASGSGTP